MWEVWIAGGRDSTFHLLIVKDRGTRWSNTAKTAGQTHIRSCWSNIMVNTVPAGEAARCLPRAQNGLQQPPAPKSQDCGVSDPLLRHRPRGAAPRQLCTRGCGRNTRVCIWWCMAPLSPFNGTFYGTPFLFLWHPFSLFWGPLFPFNGTLYGTPFLFLWHPFSLQPCRGHT